MISDQNLLPNKVLNNSLVTPSKNLIDENPFIVDLENIP